MSRLGKKGITVPQNTEVLIEKGLITVKGAKGELSKAYNSNVKIEVSDGEVVLTPQRQDKLTRALWGTYASHISNMVKGDNEEYEKKLIIEGVGFKAEINGKNLILHVGFSHPVEMEIPEGLEVSVEKDTITTRGIDKEAVGQFAADIRSQKKPEPYKGKGIRYDGEVIRRKEGKKAV
jgi:large subunit ribosomal protein L6